MLAWRAPGQHSSFSSLASLRAIHQGHENAQDGQGKAGNSMLDMCLRGRNDMVNSWNQEKDAKRNSQNDQDNPAKEKSRIFHGDILSCFIVSRLYKKTGPASTTPAPRSCTSRGSRKPFPDPGKGFLAS